MTITNRKRDAKAPTHGGTAIEVDPSDPKLVLLRIDANHAEWVRVD